MKTKKLLTALAAALVCMTTSHGQSILLGGFDGNQTQTTVAPATTTSSTGVRQLTGPLQGAGAVRRSHHRIWTDQATNKELQWNTTGGATDGLWGTSTFHPGFINISARSGSLLNRRRVGSTIEISNTGTENVTLDKFHINANRLNMPPPLPTHIDDFPATERDICQPAGPFSPVT